jgi:hypothetical protein
MSAVLTLTQAITYAERIRTLAKLRHEAALISQLAYQEARNAGATVAEAVSLSRPAFPACPTCNGLGSTTYVGHCDCEET